MHFMSTSGSCVAANYTSCGNSGGGCWCDLYCYTARDCCPDIAQTCQPRKCLDFWAALSVKEFSILSYIVTITVSRS